jgi:hypothetical protein
MKVGTGNFFIAPMEAASSSPPPPPAHDHRNDERTGQRIMWLLFATVGLCQVAVVQWRTRHPKSFNLALLACLWLFPVGLLIMQGWGALFRAPFFYVWLLFSLLMGALLGAVLLTFLLVPALLSFTLNKRSLVEKHKPWLDRLQSRYRRLVGSTMPHTCSPSSGNVFSGNCSNGLLPSCRVTAARDQSAW